MSEFGKASSSKNNVTFAETTEFPQITVQVLGGSRDVNRMYASAIRDKWNENPQAVVDALTKHEITALRANQRQLREAIEIARPVMEAHAGPERLAFFNEKSE